MKFDIFHHLRALTAFAAILASPVTAIGALPKETKNRRAALDLETLATALTAYKAMTGSYPTTKHGLKVLVEAPKTPPIPRAYVPIMEEEAKDPWGRPYKYVRKRGKFKLWSTGPDLKDPKDDIHYVAPKTNSKN